MKSANLVATSGPSLRLTFGCREVVGCNETQGDGHCVLLFDAPRGIDAIPLGGQVSIDSHAEPRVTLVFPTRAQALRVFDSMMPISASQLPTPPNGNAAFALGYAAGLEAGRKTPPASMKAT